MFLPRTEFVENSGRTVPSLTNGCADARTSFMPSLTKKDELRSCRLVIRQKFSHLEIPLLLSILNGRGAVLCIAGYGEIHVLFVSSIRLTGNAEPASVFRGAHSSDNGASSRLDVSLAFIDPRGRARVRNSGTKHGKRGNKRHRSVVSWWWPISKKERNLCHASQSMRIAINGRIIIRDVSSLMRIRRIRLGKFIEYSAGSSKLGQSNP